MTTYEQTLQTSSFFQPRLAVRTTGGGSKSSTGFLQINKEAEVLEIGNVDSPQYKLARCLFSPRNFQTAKYNSVFQTIERVFFTMHGAAAAVSQADSDSAEKIARMKLAVQNTVKKLKQTEAGKHLRFHWHGEKIQMEVVMA